MAHTTLPGELQPPAHGKGTCVNAASLQQHRQAQVGEDLGDLYPSIFWGMRNWAGPDNSAPPSQKQPPGRPTPGLKEHHLTVKTCMLAELAQ